MPSMDKMIRKGWMLQRALYDIQWRDARILARYGTLDWGDDRGHLYTPGEISRLMRDEPFDGWTDNRLRVYWVDRKMLLEFGVARWWEKERAQREAYIKAQRHWLNIKEDDLNCD